MIRRTSIKFRWLKLSISSFVEYKRSGSDISSQTVFRDKWTRSDKEKGHIPLQLERNSN